MWTRIGWAALGVAGLALALVVLSRTWGRTPEAQVGASLVIAAVIAAIGLGGALEPPADDGVRTGHSGAAPAVLITSDVGPLRLAAWGLGGVVVGLVGAGALALAGGLRPDPRWLAAAAVGLGVAWLCRGLFRVVARRSLAITATGIRLLSGDVVPWADMRAVRVGTAATPPGPGRVLGEQIAALNVVVDRRAGNPALIPGAGLPVSPEVLAAELDRWRTDARARAEIGTEAAVTRLSRR